MLYVFLHNISNAHHPIGEHIFCQGCFIIISPRARMRRREKEGGFSDPRPLIRKRAARDVSKQSREVVIIMAGPTTIITRFFQRYYRAAPPEKSSFITQMMICPAADARWTQGERCGMYGTALLFGALFLLEKISAQDISRDFPPKTVTSVRLSKGEEKGARATDFLIRPNLICPVFSQ